jgi:Glycoside hydrolase 123, catalytic domain/Glycoside hydrolase 123 N-terminal domain
MRRKYNDMDMRRLALGCAFYLCLQGTAFAQALPGQIDPQRTPALSPHFEPEHAYDVSVDSERWAHVPPGLHVAFGTTDAIYFRSEVPGVTDDSRMWDATAWRGERLNAVVLVWSADALEQVRVDVTDLADANGHTLSRDNLRLRLVRYVLSNYPAGARDATCDASRGGAWLLPDRLEPFDRFDLPGRTVRPVWLSLDVPAGATPGAYEGTLRVTAGKQTATLRMKIEVQQAVLPPPREWTFRLDLWQNPWVVAWYFHVRPWSDEHKALLKTHLKLYAEAGGKYITTYAVHSPWQDNSYMIEGGMIEWIKARDGSWKFDYRIFDEYVALAMAAGIDKAITIYTPVPWANRFRYLDEQTGNYVSDTWPPDSEAYRTVWHVFLDDLQRHLQQRGWLQRTYLGINENELSTTLAAIKVIKDHSKQWKITYAGDWHPELDGLLDDYSFVHGKEPTIEEVRARSARGATSTYYVCCTPPKPNTFVFSPPAEGRWLGWYAAAYGYDGFLRWAYDAWPADPVRDARHVLWPAGDTFLVYPGSDSSIRFEKLREGIVDYEKIWLVRQRAAPSTDPDVERLTDKLNQQLDAIAREREFGEHEVRDLLRRANVTLTALSDRLIY